MKYVIRINNQDQCTAQFIAESSWEMGDFIRTIVHTFGKSNVTVEEQSDYPTPAEEEKND